MIVTLARWGNSLALRIPKEALEQANFHEGDRLQVVADGDRLVISADGAPPSLDELISKISPENRHDIVFDDAAVGSEFW